MAALMDLPNEILISILDILSIVDLQSAILLQLMNRRLHALIKDILFDTRKISNRNGGDDAEGIEINPLWRTKFKGLFNTSVCFTDAERTRMAYLTLDGDYTLPFRRLPWAQTESERDAYLRPGATWREISLTFGRAPITHLDVVKSYFAQGGDVVDYYQVDLPPSGMTMGLFYDVLLSEKATYGHETGSWELIVGRRLRSFDVLFEYECFISDDRDMVDVGKEACQAAILYVQGGPVSRKYTSDTVEDSWVLNSKTNRRLLPWQGPIQNFIFTGYYD
ncbi:uncharacterized protein F4812DRAFT_456938 [Daldinia caldariorum]|uniref:uncharacterized protein n=1 Tax=Daldinia caldariorum TaxID=326644 RepID=UPI002008B93B|nr:uncharacterized protein F4812DRAFT_456938 [Daldinia caldariorum]KAI1470928.1 hypothetical protein F4812DRAFT_456938 [Daldinia caldariorum]